MAGCDLYTPDCEGYDCSECETFGAAGFWQHLPGVMTPGGDPAWYCPFCGGGRHVCGIETQMNHLDICPDCGAPLSYR